MDNYLTALQHGTDPGEVWKTFLEDQAHKTRESLLLSRNVAKLSIDEAFKWIIEVWETSQKLKASDFEHLRDLPMEGNVVLNGYATFVDAEHELHSLMLCKVKQTNERTVLGLHK